MKPCSSALQSTRLIDQVRERIRYLHYSLSTKKLYVYWVRFFIRWHGLRQPRDMGLRRSGNFCPCWLLPAMYLRLPTTRP